MEGVLIVSAIGNFPAQQTLRVRGLRVRERDLKTDGRRVSVAEWVGLAQLWKDQ